VSRLFFAADIPEEERALLGKLQQELKQFKADVKWVEPKNLHITLRFLGDVHQKQIPELKRIGEEVGKLYGGFQLSFKALGVFPPKSPARVVWAGIDEGKTHVSMLAQAVTSRVSKLKVEKEEHEFKPHVTLGRIKNPNTTQELLLGLQLHDFESRTWLLKNFVLKESILSKSGSTYKDLLVFPLGKR